MNVMHGTCVSLELNSKCIVVLCKLLVLYIFFLLYKLLVIVVWLFSRLHCSLGGIIIFSFLIVLADIVS